MNIEPSGKAAQLAAELRSFIADHVLAQDEAFRQAARAGVFPVDIVEPLKARAKARGLWNLFLPTLPDDAPGQRLTNVDFLPLAEIMGRIPWSSEVFNCSPPDAVNMEILSLFGSTEQRQRWLRPLLDGTIRSSIGMSERDVPGSDLTGSRTTITRDGADLVLHGHKWFVNGALHPHFDFVTVFAREAGRPGDAQHSWVFVPAGTPGFEIVRDLPIMGQPWPQGYCEVRFDGARVPATNLLGEPGSGLSIAQALLGPALVHHCARSVGQCELALELTCERALSRRPAGTPLAERANIRDWIARSRLEIEQVRLLVARCASIMDRDGNAAAATEISMAKVAAAQLHTTVLDRAMQVFGALSLTAETPLAYFWTWARSMRFIDGPDESHLDEIARVELGKRRDGSVLPG